MIVYSLSKSKKTVDMIIVFLKYNMESRLTINENIILHRFYQMREEKFFESLFLYITVDNWDEESK